MGDALLHVTDAYRINYSILGNLDPALHAHVHPRYKSEQEEMRKGPIWRYGRDFERTNPFDETRDRPLMDAIKAYLECMGPPYDDAVRNGTEAVPYLARGILPAAGNGLPCHSDRLRNVRSCFMPLVSHLTVCAFGQDVLYLSM